MNISFKISQHLVQLHSLLVSSKVVLHQVEQLARVSSSLLGPELLRSETFDLSLVVEILLPGQQSQDHLVKR